MPNQPVVRPAVPDDVESLVILMDEFYRLAPVAPKQPQPEPSEPVPSRL